MQWNENENESCKSKFEKSSRDEKIRSYNLVNKPFPVQTKEPSQENTRFGFIAQKSAMRGHWHRTNTFF